MAAHCSTDLSIKVQDVLCVYFLLLPLCVKPEFVSFSLVNLLTELELEKTALYLPSLLVPVACFQFFLFPYCSSFLFVALICFDCSLLCLNTLATH